MFYVDHIEQWHMDIGILDMHACALPYIVYNLHPNNAINHFSKLSIIMVIDFMLFFHFQSLGLFSVCQNSEMDFVAFFYYYQYC